MNKQFKGCIMLFMTALIWGTTFVAQKSGMNHVGPFTFNFVRSAVGALVLVPVILFMDKLKAKDGTLTVELTAEEKTRTRKTLLMGGIINGVALFGSMTLQQVGLVSTDVGKASFITAMYIVLVPLFGLFLRQKMRMIESFCVALGSIGLYFLCLPAGSSFAIERGDFLIFLCAVLCAIQIHTVDYYTARTDGVRISCLQLLVMAILSSVPALVLESPSIKDIMAGAFPILYAGILSCGVAYTLQIVAQKYVKPTAASLILSLESVFGVLAGMIILGERLTGRETLGCITMFVAIILAQLPSKKKD